MEAASHIHFSEISTFWTGVKNRLPLRPLYQNIDVDVCVVGGGLAGLLTAYTLLKEGLDVCVLESSDLGSGQTSRSSAHLSNVLDDGFVTLEKLYGIGGATLAVESHSAALHLYEEIVRGEKIDCDLERVPGSLFAEDERQLRILKKEFEVMKRIGLFKNLEFFPTGPFAASLGSVCVSDQMQFHPLKMLCGLTETVFKKGGKIYPFTHVEEIKTGDLIKVRTSGGHAVTSRAIVVATHSPIGHRIALGSKQASYSSYVITYEIPKNSFPKILAWDVGDPYHYIRVVAGEKHDILMVGGEDHRTGRERDPQSRFQKLDEWIRSRGPKIGKEISQWSGQLMEPADGLAYLGRFSNEQKNVYIITGDSGHGLTHAAIGAMIISDQITGRQNRWEELYSPSRNLFAVVSESFQYTEGASARP